MSALMRALPKHLQRQGNILKCAGRMATRTMGTKIASSAGQGTKKGVWSGMLSFASPESDFTAQADIAIAERAFSNTPQNQKLIDPIWSDFSTAQTSSTTSTNEKFGDMAYSLSFATPESDFSSPHILSLLDERQRQQLAEIEKNWASPHDEVVVYDTRRELLDDDAAHEPDRDTEQVEVEPQFHYEEVFARTDARPLPSTYAEATLEGDDRAIVVTEAAVPFKINHVNSAWEGLCGYTLEESKGKTLGDLLQGPETDASAATALIDKLLHGMEAGAVLTNYAKGGRKFQNRIRVGTLKDDNDRVTHFVGVLKEITELEEHFDGKKNAQMA